MYFIASPFSNAPDKEERRKSITKISSDLMRRGFHVVCPMTLGLAFTDYSELPIDSEWWLDWTTNLLVRCDKMLVLCYEGWEDSLGVSKEIEIAKQFGIQIDYIQHIN